MAFVDADDIWMPEKLQFQMQYLVAQPEIVWAYCDAELFDSQSGRTLSRLGRTTRLLEGDILRPLLLGCFIPSPTPVIRRAVFSDAGLFDESPLLRIGEDWNLWLRIAARYPIGLIDRPLARLRVHPGSTTGQMDLQYALQSELAVIENAISREPVRLADIRARAIARVYSGIGEWMARRGDRLGARGMFARSLRVYPFSARVLGYWVASLIARLVLPAARILSPSS